MYYLTRPSFITPELETEFQNYCVTKYPAEACAFVIKGKLVPVENVAEFPNDHFALSSKDQLRILTAQAFLHSHPDGEMSPSEADMRAQIAANIPFGLCMNTAQGAERIVWWGDHLLDLPTLERPFISGVFDCYEAVRAIYWQERQIKLKAFAREDDWWNTEANLIEDSLIKSDFRISTEEPKKYDLYAMSFTSNNKITHLAVNLGEGRLLHHLENGVSKIDYSVRYAKFIEKVYTYHDSN